MAMHGSNKGGGDKVGSAKTKIHQNKPMTKGKGTEEYGNPANCSDPWEFMEKDIKPKQGPNEF